MLSIFRTLTIGIFTLLIIVIASQEIGVEYAISEKMINSFLAGLAKYCDLSVTSRIIISMIYIHVKT